MCACTSGSTRRRKGGRHGTRGTPRRTEAHTLRRNIRRDTLRRRDTHNRRRTARGDTLHKTAVHNHRRSSRTDNSHKSRRRRSNRGRCGDSLRSRPYGRPHNNYSSCNSYNEASRTCRNTLPFDKSRSTSHGNHYNKTRGNSPRKMPCRTRCKD